MVKKSHFETLVQETLVYITKVNKMTGNAIKSDLQLNRGISINGLSDKVVCCLFATCQQSTV